MPCCFWCNDDPLYMARRDKERGVLQRDPDALFELLLLEGFQAGLSQITVLKRRERYCEMLFGLDVQRVAQMSDAGIDELMFDPDVIRNRAKPNVTRQNARARLELDDLAGFLWSFVDGQLKTNYLAGRVEVPAITPEAEVMSRALRKVGFSFVGPTICYASMQASGMAMDHTQDCDRYAQFVG